MVSERAVVGPRTGNAQGALRVSMAECERLVEAFLRRRNPSTERTYRAALGAFRAYVEADTLGDAVYALLTAEEHAANALVVRFAAHDLARGRAVATANLHLAALSALVSFAKRRRLVSWALCISCLGEPPASAPVPTADVARVLSDCAQRDGAKGKRAYAAARLALDLALRVRELVGLDVGDVDLDGGLLTIGRHRLRLPAPTRVALEHWLEVRGDGAGPLFIPLRGAAGRPWQRPSRLGGHSLWRDIAEAGRRVGVLLSPTTLRRAAILRALDITGGNLRAVGRFARLSPAQVLGYLPDERVQLGELARAVAGSVGGEEWER